MDYAMLSRLQIQSMTDQEDYLKLPAILVGASAAVLPEQLAIWSYPLAKRCRSSQLQHGYGDDVPHPPEWPLDSLPRKREQVPKASGSTRKFFANTFLRRFPFIRSACLT